jgi:protein-S-isoprenylcysteine O-methyltransferase Ste14
LFIQHTVALSPTGKKEENMRDSAVIPLVIVLVNVGERVLDSLLRKDSVAKSLKTSEDDKGTSRFIQVVAALYVVVLLLTSLLNQFQIGIVEPHLVFTAIGVVLMAVGVVIRVVAMRTLGKFFTRTLQIREGHHVVSDGIYRRVRHPGYLGDILFFVGSGIATSNVISTLLILGMFLSAYARRIAVEEWMLTNQLGKEYSDYRARTWKLIPFIF